MRRLLCAFLFPLAATAQDAATPFTRAHVDALAWRSVGPANMGGRVTDIELAPGDASTWYVASASGGLWKTINAGTTWQALFQHESCASIGDVAVARSDPRIVWVGTGEENARNSVSWGDGVYKSTDGGETFAHMGLRESFQIGHVEIHPTDPDVVFVAALGELWGTNAERGVFRTRDGGATWDHVLFCNDRTGAVDVRIDPSDPRIVHACTYERQRDGFDGNDPAVRFGDDAGLFRSTDGGDTWSRITSGLPACAWGRSGLAVLAADPATLYLIVETERSGWATGDERHGRPQGDALMGVSGDPASGGIELTAVTEDGPADRAGLVVGDVILKLDDVPVDTTEGFVDAIRSKRAGDTVVVTYLRDGETATTELTYDRRRGQRPPANGPHALRLGGQRANVQDEQGERGFETGGLFRSDDRGESWRRVNSLTERPFYYSVIAVDPQDAQNVYSCGVSLWASADGGAEFTAVQRGIHVDFHAIAVDPSHSDHLIVGCDGGVYESWSRGRTWRHVDNLEIAQFYHASTDDAVPYRIYGGLQDNGTWAGPSRTRHRDGIRSDDWVTIGGADGFRAFVDPQDPSVAFLTSQYGGIGRQDLARVRSGGRIAKPEGVRFAWDTPFLLSPHNPQILWFAGTVVCRSLDRGAHSTDVSEAIGRTRRGAATALAESPRRAGLVYAGTDDGALWRTDDGGATWQPLHQNLAGLPGPRYVSHLEPSHYVTDRVYATFDGHRSDDLDAHVLVSDDRGETWRPLRNDLPNEPCHVIREYPLPGAGPRSREQDLLFVGTEFGCYVSLDRGAHWLELGDGLPTVAVRDLAIQVRDSDLVAATHGRGLWILDLQPLLQLTPQVAGSAAHLFEPERAVLWQVRGREGFRGHASWAARNPAYGASLHLWLAEPPPGDARLTIHDVTGARIRALALADRAGIHTVTWDARREGEPPPRQGGRARPGPLVGPGSYAVRYRHGDRELVAPLELVADPGGGRSPLAEEEN